VIDQKRTESKGAARSLHYDLNLLFPVLFLVGIGIVMVYSASSALAMKKFGSDGYFLKKQAVFSLIGFITLVFCRHVPYRVFRVAAYPILFTSIGLLSLTHTSQFGVSVGGASRWVRFGGLQFQPVEFARFALILYLSYSIADKFSKGNIKMFSVGFFPHVIVLGMMAVVIFFQPDFGSILILSILAWIMMFVGGVRTLHLITSLAPLLPLAYYFMVSAEYRLKRILTFLDPWQYPQEEGYQIVHSLMAFGSGGLWGAGVGKGYQKLFYLPEPHTDFIFSVIGEELGLFGVLVIVGLFSLIIWRGILISANTDDLFGSLVALGITAALGLQVCVNMGVSLGLLPAKGLTLPFLSYGGTSLLINMASVGILMNIAASRPR